MKFLRLGLSNIDGFLTLGKHIGIKYKRPDFGILYSKTMCQVAAVYTQNQIKGAPLHITMEHLRNHEAQAIVVNSGIANVATGSKGLEDARTTAKLAARELGIQTDAVLVASTGVIGKPLPMEKIASGIQGAFGKLRQTSNFAKAILTTDSVTKEICVQHQNFMIAGVAKGSGMIAPNMATMLAFIITDADIPAHELDPMLKASVDKSFNMVNVDMDTSTSDMVIVMANGRVKNVDRAGFRDALEQVCTELAKKIARDGEGATKLITAQVTGARSLEDGRLLARAIVSSNLVKCAIYGHDPNWGRLMCALGNSGAGTIHEGSISIWINQAPVVSGGTVDASFDEDKLSRSLAIEPEAIIRIDMGCGESQAEAYGCDMSVEYVKINADYTT